MAAGYSTTLRNAQLNAITTFCSDGAKLRVYDGTQPSTGGAATTLLLEYTLGSPLAGGASSGSLSVTLPTDTVGLAIGTATWWRIVKSDGTTHCIDGTAGTSGTDLILTSTSITIGLNVGITSMTITRGNA